MKNATASLNAEVRVLFEVSDGRDDACINVPTSTIPESFQ
jgi:hypothetical protein